MHQVSDLYKKILRLPHRVENRLEIYGQTYTRAHILSLDVTRQVFKEEVPSVGNTPAGMITVSMLTPAEEFPIQEKIQLSSRIVSGDLESEWVPKGAFYIDTRHPAQLSTGENVQIEIVGYDRMLMAEKDYSPTGQWPRTDADVLVELCQLIGVECEEVLDKGYLISEPDEYTCRELLGYIGAMYGGNWVVDDFGKLRLLRLGSPGGASEAMAQSLSVGAPLSPITQVVLHRMDGTSFTAGTAGRALNVNCPWATQEMAEGILQQVQGFRYQPFSAEEAAIDPALELGDQVTKPDGGVIGTVYQLYAAHSDVLTADMSAPPEEEINHDFPARSTAGGAAGRAMNATRRAMGTVRKLKKETEESIRQAREKLVADIGDVQAGLDAIAKADDIKGFKEANTTLFAKVMDENGLLWAGVNAKLASSEFGEYREAQTKLYAQVTDGLAGCVKEAYLELYAVSDGKGNTTTFADLVADTIALKGRVDLTGTLSVSNGIITSTGQIISQKNIRANTGLSSTKLELDTNDFKMAGKQYVPTEITSTTGAVTALGCT